MKQGVIKKKEKLRERKNEFCNKNNKKIYSSSVTITACKMHFEYDTKKYEIFQKPTFLSYD